MKRCLTIILTFSILLMLPSRAVALPVPADQELFAYDPVTEPVLSDIPGQAKPIGVGPAAHNGDILRQHIALNQFQAPVDIYFAIYAPALSASILILQPDSVTLLPIETGLKPWRNGVTGPINEFLFGDIPFNQLPPGRYTFYLLAAHPSGTFNSFYLWTTWLEREYQSVSESDLKMEFELDGASGFATLKANIYSCSGITGPWRGSLEIDYSAPGTYACKSTGQIEFMVNPDTLKAEGVQQMTSTKCHLLDSVGCSFDYATEWIRYHIVFSNDGKSAQVTMGSSGQGNMAFTCCNDECRTFTYPVWAIFWGENQINVDITHYEGCVD